ncbi:MAG: hypothetical protein K2J01_01560 [Clostridiales bacterium]|nr:hypothetical protein [Clostridiales bacterium]
MFRAALIGKDIAYTRSPAVHKAIAEVIGVDIEFDVFDVPYGRLDDAVRSLLRDYDGFYVTKPYKTEIKRFIDCAEQSVNLVRCADKTAYNTDGAGFIRALGRNFNDWQASVKSALVLGTGGGAYAVVKALNDVGKKVYVLGRSNVNAARLAASCDGAELYANQQAELIVNCTPLGTAGEDALSAFCVLPSFKYAFDLVYATHTPFLRRNRDAGAQVADGKDMLIYQAIDGDKILLNGDFDIEKVYEFVADRLAHGGDSEGE